jgi:haloalkane dehalogenase
MRAAMIDRTVTVDGLKLHYVEEGEGEPVLLLHGWPTSSFLYRQIIGPIAARGRRVIALDLPGFGASDKPPDASYSFPFFGRVLDGFLDAVGAETLGLVVHDLGGPVGVWWAAQHRERVTKLALLNTLLYPELSWAVWLFMALCRLPVVRDAFTSPAGLRWAMRFGVHDMLRLSDETIRAYQAPFAAASARRALQRSAYGLHPGGMRDIAAFLSTLRIPVRIIYGARDPILPDVANTMARVARDAPQAQTTVLEDCAHFLQEERPEEIAAMLAEFFHQGS